MADVTHDPRTDWSACFPEGPDLCAYRMLANTVIEKFNPHDGDDAEVSLCMAAVERAATYIEAQPCECADLPHGATCGRCYVLGQWHGKPTHSRTRAGGRLGGADGPGGVVTVRKSEQRQRTVMVSVRFTPAELEIVQACARLMDAPISGYLRNLALRVPSKWQDVTPVRNDGILAYDMVLPKWQGDTPSSRCYRLASGAKVHVKPDCCC